MSAAVESSAQRKAKVHPQAPRTNSRNYKLAAITPKKRAAIHITAPITRVGRFGFTVVAKISTTAVGLGYRERFPDRH
jgi:hypothetical protein